MVLSFREDEKNEFKESLSQLNKGIKSLTAMLNRGGEGNVYFGVDDNGKVTGLTIGKDTLQDIHQKIRDLVSPQVVVSIKSLMSIDGYEYICVSAKGSDIPYSCDGRYYIRSGSSDEQLTPHMLRKILESGDTDLIQSASSYEQELTFDGFFHRDAGAGHHPSATKGYYQSKRFFNLDGKFNLMAYLLSDQCRVSMNVAQFEGLDKARISKRTDFGSQDIVSAMQHVLDHFRSIDTTRVDLSQGVRVETPLFDYESFREAWINACLHNHWVDMIPPSVFLFDDRIEILSYGDLPYGLSLEDFYSGTSKPVNRSLKDIFVSLGYSEQSGHGVPIVVKHYGREAFAFSSGTVKVTIPFAYSPDWVSSRRSMENSVNELTDNQRAVLRYFNDHPKAKQSEAAAELGISLPGIKKIVGRLRQLGLLDRNGGKRSGRWKSLVLF